MKHKQLIIFLLLSASSVQAIEVPLVDTCPRAVAQLRWSKIRGHVVAVSPESHTLQLADREGNITLVTVDKNVQILRYYRVVDLGVLKPLDKVELRYLGAL